MKNSASTWRIVWKDYRTYRPIWLVLFGIAILIQLLMAIFDGAAFVQGSSMVLVLGMPVVFAVAVSAVAFSQEHEVGTFAYLQSLPLGPFDLFIARMLHVLLGSLAMFFTLSLLLPLLATLAPAGASLFDSYRGITALSPLYVCITLFAVAIGTLCSLLTKHPLRAALIAAMIVCVMQMLGSSLPSGAQMLLSLAIGGTVLLIDICLSRRWLIDRRRAATPGWLARCFDLNARSAIFRSASGRLIWAHQRRLRWIYLLTFGFVLLITANSGPPEMPGLLFVTLVISGALGVSVFYVDQRDQAYRFYAAHGISPRVVWAARHAVGLALLLVLCQFIYVVLHGPNRPMMLLTFLPLLAYGCGQLTMLVTRSSLIAIFLSFAFSLLMGAWGWLAYWMEVPWWIVIVPFSLALMVASWVRMRGWMLEQDTPRQTARPLAIALAGVVVTIAMLGVFRVVEIPGVSRAVAATAPQTRLDSASKTAEQYLLQAVDLLTRWNFPSHLRSNAYYGAIDPDDVWSAPKPNDELFLWLQKNQETLGKVEAAFEETDQLSFPKDDEAAIYYLLHSRLPSLVHLLIVQAHKLQSEGELDAAWEAYRQALELSIQLRGQGGQSEWASALNETLVYDNLIWWASAEDQTLDRVDSAIRYLTELGDRQPDAASAFARQYHRNDRLIAEAPASLEQLGWPSEDIQSAAFVYRLWPWERMRSRRALRFHAYSEQDSLLQYATAIEYGKPVDALLREQADRDPDPKVYRTLLVPRLLSTAYVYTQLDATVRNRHRAAMLQLSLIAYKMQHGQYPESLNALDEEMELEHRDVFTGRPMIYFAEGKDVDVLVHLDGRRVRYPKGQPFLWSPGHNLKLRYGADPFSFTSYQLWTLNNDAARQRLHRELGDGTPEELVWRAGELYGLP